MKKKTQKVVTAPQSPLQSFLAEQAARMKAEPDKRIVFVAATIAQMFVGMHDQLRQSALQGATMNVMNAYAAGGKVDIMDVGADFAAIQYAYEFLAACAALTVREVSVATGSDVDAYPELDAFVASFKAKRWGVAGADGATIVN